MPPLGYDVENRRLVPNEREAKLIRHIFQRFVELGSSTALVKELKLDGVTSKAWTTQDGKTRDGRPWDVAPTSIQLALARGHRWLAMLESGKAKSLKEIATREGIDNSYVSRMVNLTTLAPDIVAAILDDALPNHITLFDLAVDPPALWDEQRERVGL